MGVLGSKKTQETAADNKLLVDLLIATWRDVLPVADLQPDQNFFEVGGDSLTALRAVSILKKWPVDISVVDIFNRPTVRELSNRITHPLGSLPVDLCSPAAYRGDLDHDTAPSAEL
jgi:aryl carrier-like protein